ncbi:hypothetical protein P154DRAFT_461780 [Amniculicola lignicola CBS 123094]|uniref:Nuclear pore assembly and biogenesis-domain-containing protein n=1 Tax=Amniculicola lignicola CBS 123094 TaxID=1392246 RepID=A0A6A5WLK4_9PLEO|nr:hypothetical protein P154DRAFT_461780 [Amniculicola lignicola CBS 123094]
MDFFQNYVNLLPPSLLTPTIKIISTTFGIAKTLQSHLTPFLSKIITKPDVASIILLVILLVVSLKILDMAFRAVLFWIKLVLRLAMWGAIGSIGLWVYTRGVDGFIDDVSGLAEHWKAEYDRYSGEVKGYKSQQERFMGQRAQAQAPGAYGSGRGAARGWR